MVGLKCCFYLLEFGEIKEENCLPSGGAPPPPRWGRILHYFSQWTKHRKSPEVAEKIFSKNVKGSDRKLASSSIPHESKKTRRAGEKKSKPVSFALLCMALLSVNSKLVKWIETHRPLCLCSSCARLPLIAGCSPRCCEDSRISSLAVALAACAHPEEKKNNLQWTSVKVADIKGSSAGACGGCLWYRQKDTRGGSPC